MRGGRRHSSICLRDGGGGGMGTTMGRMLVIHTYSSPEEAFCVNSYWLEMQHGVVVIGTQFLISQARNLQRDVESTGKPILAVIITHPHPDHCNGTGILLEGHPDVPVYATWATFTAIKATEERERDYWKSGYGADYPSAIVLPTRLLDSGAMLGLGGLRFHFRDIGAGESLNQTLVSLDAEHVLFCGDLVSCRVHPWLAEGRSSAWLEQLGFVLKEYPTITTVYPGHGQPTTLIGLNEQVAYVNTVQSLVRDEIAATGSVTDEGKAAINDAVEQRFPDQPLAMLHDRNIEAVAAELSGRLA